MRSLRASISEWRCISLLGALLFCSGALSRAIEVDFASDTGSTGPFMFGGAHIPPPEHADALPTLRKVGVTHIRYEISLQEILPAGITLADYRANRGGASEPATWNWAPTATRLARLEKAGLASYGILLWNPTWLTKNGKNNGEVLDYDVWEDIVHKILVRVGKRFEFIEIWNEPCWKDFLDLGSEWSADRVKSVTLNYHRSALRAAKDLGLKLGGPGCYGWWRDELIRTILSDAFVRERISFVSWHHYDKEHNAEYADLDGTRTLVRTLAGRDLEMHVSEWNYSGDSESYPEFQNSRHAVSWVGKKLIEQYRLGVDSSTIYHISNGPWGYEYRRDNGRWGGYEWTGQTALPYRYLATYNLMSNALGLGTRDMRLAIVAMSTTDLPPTVAAAALRNSRREGFILLASHGAAESTRIDVRVRNFDSATAGKIRVRLYRTGTDDDKMDVTSPSEEVVFDSDPSEGMLTVTLPPYTVLGMRFDRVAKAPAPRSRPEAPLLRVQ